MAMKSTTKHKLAGHKFDVSFCYLENGDIRYCIVLPNVRSSTGTVEDLTKLQERITREVNEWGLVALGRNGIPGVSE
jgi:hypothetical protein